MNTETWMVIWFGEYIDVLESFKLRQEGRENGTARSTD